jgi:hypothetical protein
MAACAVPHARARFEPVGVSRLASRRLVASRAGSRRVFLARADAESTRSASAPRRPEGDLEWWTLRARAAAFACVASAVLASGAAAEPAVASREANAVAARRDRARIVDDDAVSFFFDASARDDADAASSSVGVATEFESEGAVVDGTNALSEPPAEEENGDVPQTETSLQKLLAAAAENFIKPLLGEFGAAVLGFGAGAVASGFFFGWRVSVKERKGERAASRAALADLSTLDESEIQDLIGELPAWLAFRDVERGGWVNKVLAAAWPYLDVATSDVIVAALDPILRATRPSFLTALRFEKFSFGSVPAKIEGVKVFDTVNDGAVEIDLSVFWKGDPDVVLGVRAAQDTLSVPVSLTEFECAFTLRLIFAPLIGVFPCFGALTIALVDEPKLDFDLRVVGGDVTLVPGLKESLRTYIKALIASWMVWPRCITVAIPGTGYTLPESDEADSDERNTPPVTGLLHVQVVGHDARALGPGDVGLQVRSSSGPDLRYRARGSDAAETRVKALPGGGVLSSREVTLPVEDPTTQLLCVRWYSKPVGAPAEAAREKNGGENSSSAVERLTGEASIVLEELMRQAPEARESSERGVSNGERDDENDETRNGQWGPVPVAAELEAPAGADITRVRGDGAAGGVRGVARRAARGVGGFFGKTAGGVVAGVPRRAERRFAAGADSRRRRRRVARARRAIRGARRSQGPRGAGASIHGDVTRDGASAVGRRAPFGRLRRLRRGPGRGRGSPARAVPAPGRGGARAARAAKESDSDSRQGKMDENSPDTNDTRETKTHTNGASQTAPPSTGPLGRSLSAASRSVIDGAYASGEFFSRSTGSGDPSSDALETARALLRQREREMAEMRVEKAALEKKLRSIDQSDVEGRDGEYARGSSDDVVIRGGGATRERETRSNLPSTAFENNAMAVAPDERDASKTLSKKERERDAAASDAAAALVASPAADADPRLAPLVAAARVAAAAVKEARGAASRGFGRLTHERRRRAFGEERGSGDGDGESGRAGGARRRRGGGVRARRGDGQGACGAEARAAGEGEERGRRDLRR